MSAAIVKIAVLAAISLAPLAASAQGTDTDKSERGMPDVKTAPADAKSERAMPDKGKDAAPAPAAAERAMPSPEKK